MAPEIPTVRFDEIRPLTGEVFHAAGSRGQADLYRIEWQGRAAILKDYSGRPWWIRATLGRIITAREYRALRRLWGVPGIPRILARVESLGLIMEYIDAEIVPGRRDDPPPYEFFDRARELLGRLHERGISHGDVRRKNLLMDAEGNPWLVDFATAVTCREGIEGLFPRFWFRHCVRVDLMQLVKLKELHYAERLTVTERAMIEEPPGHLKVGRAFKKNVNRVRKRRHRRRFIERIMRGIQSSDDGE